MADRMTEGDPLRADVAQIGRAVSRAAELTAQLLAFSRKQVMAPRVVRLNDVVAGMEKMLPRILGEDVLVEYRVDADTGSVRVDPGQIDRVVMNLAVNARDAMPDGGTLAIETAAVTPDAAFLRAHPEVPPGDYAMLAVTDTGSGMDRGTLARIFEPFFTTKSAGKGTGLGLSMVYGVVKQSNGFIYCTSELGRGTTFRIYFPRQPDAGEDGGTRPAQAADDRAGTGTVLVVEDEDAIRTLVRTILARRGYEVFVAADGHEALEIAARHGDRFDLLLTDVVMPRMNGAELAGRLREISPRVKVLYMSGYAETAIAHQGRLEEGVDLLEKPFDPNTLLERVRRALARAG
jgi:CheY-like chemotaxis protein